LRTFLTLAALAATVCAAPRSANAATSYTLVTEPDQGLTAIYNLVNSARHTIDMTMYELNDTTFEQYLVNQAKAGVTVRVILDINLEQSNNQAAYTYLNANGVTTHWANTTYAATHQKTITIDANYSNAQTAIMTLNLTTQYYPTSRDFAIIENDPNDIAAIETTFQDDFNSASITPPTGDDLVWSPTNSQTAMLALINGAQHTLLVENEEMSDTAIVSALVSAAKRGVNVQVIMNAGTTYESEWNQITAAGGDVSTYPATTTGLYIHAKVILADYGYATASVFQGSENFSSASLTENRELGLIIDNVPVMSSLFATLTSDFNGGTAYTGSPANFTLSPSPASLSVAAGSTAPTAITATPFNAFKTAVTLSATGLPSGVTASFSPASISGGSGSSTLTLKSSASVAAGTYLIGIVGTAGSLTNSTAVSLTLTGGTPIFTLSASPASLSIAAGSSGSSTITSAVSGGFSSAVALTAGGLPTGVTASFSPASISGGAGSSTLTLTASGTAAAGTSTVTVAGTGGGLTETTAVTLTIPGGTSSGFTISASPASLTVTQGASAATTVTTAVTGGFSSAVSLTAGGLPAGVTSSFSPASITGAGNSTLTLAASATATIGTATVTVTGTGGGLTETTAVSLTVSATAQLITDGGFESATASGLTAPGWTATTNLSSHNIVIYHGSYPHTGSNYALLGGVNNANDTLTQTITVPAGSTSTPLTFWVSIYTKETTTTTKYDYLYVEIHNTSGTLLATPLTLSNLNSTSDSNTLGTYFQPTPIDLSAHAGQTIELVFHGTNDYEDPTTFLIDDVSVTAN
jgi:hypothetical protein